MESSTQNITETGNIESLCKNRLLKNYVIYGFIIGIVFALILAGFAQIKGVPVVEVYRKANSIEKITRISHLEFNVPKNWYYGSIQRNMMVLKDEKMEMEFTLTLDDRIKTPDDYSSIKLLKTIQSAYGMNLKDSDFFPMMVGNRKGYFHEYIQRNRKNAFNERLISWVCPQNKRTYLLEVDIPLGNSWNRYNERIHQLTNSIRCV